MSYFCTYDDSLFFYLIKTNGSRILLKQIQKHFKNSTTLKNILAKITKISYSCIRNIEKSISHHNNILLNNYITCKKNNYNEARVEKN